MRGWENLTSGTLCLLFAMIFWDSNSLNGYLSKINLFLGLANIACFVDRRTSI